jgi:hypothetical protein
VFGLYTFRHLLGVSGLYLFLEFGAALCALINTLVLSAILFPGHRLHAAVASILLGIFWTIITFNQIRGFEVGPAMLVALLMISALPLILLLVVPAKATSRRLIFLALGLLLLIALNELSKLAPKLHEWGL